MSQTEAPEGGAAAVAAGPPVKQMGAQAGEPDSGSVGAASTDTIDPRSVDRSLRSSIKDGVAWAVMAGAGERYVSPFIILGQGSLLRLAGITALPGVAGAIVQCVAANVVDAVGRRRAICVGAATAQALTWVPFCVGMFLPEPFGYWLMLAAFTLYIGFGNFGGPAWNSLMGQLVPIERRGRYFGLRNTLIGVGLIASSLGAGAWVTYARGHPGLGVLGLNGQNFAFLTLFVTAMLARLVSARYLHQMHEPPYRRQPSDRFTLLEFIGRAPRAHFGRFVFYGMWLNAGVGFVGPFFFWYVLSELRFSPAAFAVLTAVNWLAYFGSSLLWGRLTDRIGSKRVLSIGGIGMVFIPLLLLGATELWWFAIVQAYEGLVTSAFGIASMNYLFDVVTGPKRARCSAYNALFVTTGTALGTLAGALVATHVSLPLVLGPVTIGHPFTLLCLGSLVLRLLPNLLLLRSFQEFRLRRPAFA